MPENNTVSPTILMALAIFVVTVLVIIMIMNSLEKRKEQKQLEVEFENQSDTCYWCGHPIKPEIVVIYDFSFSRPKYTPYTYKCPKCKARKRRIKKT